MATSIKQADFVATALRMPKELHERLHAAAKASGRSYNSEMLHRLQGSFEGGNVTLPEALVKRLADEAAANGWPFESELIHRIVDSFGESAVAGDDPGKRAAVLGESVQVYQTGMRHLAVLNQALAHAVLALANGGKPKEGDAIWQAGRMAEALVRGDALAFYRESVVAFKRDSERVVHLDLVKNLAELEPRHPNDEFELPAFPSKEDISDATPAKGRLEVEATVRGKPVTLVREAGSDEVKTVPRPKKKR